MGFSMSSRSRNRLKSVSLRTNEEFDRLYNDATNARRLYFQRNHPLEHYLGDWHSYSIRWHSQPVPRYVPDWERFQDCLRDVDKLLKRAEKNAQFCEVLSGIMPQCEQKIFFALTWFRLYFEGKTFYYMNARSRTLLIAQEILLQELLEVSAECVSSGLESAHKLEMSALVLLSFLYQYLIGCVDKGGSKTYSPGSFLFRFIFVAILLFLGSYVWIKSRQTSFTANRRKRKLGDESDVPGGVYRRAVKNTRGSVTHYKYEPRFKPLREKPESGPPLNFNCLSLGSYNTRREAEIVRHIAAVLYGKEEVRPVQFEDGLCLPFPSVTEPEKCPSSGKEKAVWVTHKTKQLYAELLRVKARRGKLLHPAVETGSHDGHDGEARRSDPSPSAPGAPSTAMKLTCLTSPHGGNGVVEQATTSESHGIGQEAPLAREELSAFFSDSDFDPVISSMPEWEENDFPTMDDLDKAVADYSETGRVFGCESTLVRPQSSALDMLTSAFSASLPQLGVGDQGLGQLGVIEPHLNSATEVPFQQFESLPEQVQLQVRVTCQEKRPEEFSGSHFELQQKLLQSEERISELQRKLRQSEVEKKKWRSMFRQLAKLIGSSDEDGSPFDIQ